MPDGIRMGAIPKARREAEKTGPVSFAVAFG